MRTKCSKGHKFTPENTYRRIDGKRGCITCRNIAFGVVQLPHEEVGKALKAGVDDFRALLQGLHQDLSNNERIALQYIVDDLEEVIDDLFFTPTSEEVLPQVGDEVSVKYDDDYYEESHITEVKGDRVFLDDEYDRSYDIQTGKINWRTYGCRNLHDITVIYDNGYAFQHWEDLSLGEGDTL